MWKLLKGAEQAGQGVLGRKTLKTTTGTDGLKAFLYYSELWDLQLFIITQRVTKPATPV